LKHDTIKTFSDRTDRLSTSVLTALKANVVASEIRDPGKALPRAIKAAMIVVLSSYELINMAYYVLLPWKAMGSTDAVAVVAMKSAFGHWAGTVVSILVALSCAGSITSNVFTIGRLTVAAAQRQYLPRIFSERGLPNIRKQTATSTNIPSEGSPLLNTNSAEDENTRFTSRFDAPMYAIYIPLIAFVLTYIIAAPML
jgi:L-type amino acid transporter 9